MARNQLQTLTEPMYYILLSLTEERYGYEIMQVISEKTSGRLDVGPGTLYTLLSRFVDEGIIEQLRVVERRKVYIITDMGMEILKKEYERLKQLVVDGESIIYGELHEEIEEEQDQYETEETQEDQKIFRKPSDESIFF